MNQIEIKRRQVQLCSMGLGLIVIWILGKSIGDNGVAYLAAALESFAIIWVIIGANMPDTLGKLIRSRNAKGQYKNATKLRKSAFIFQSIVGIIGSIVFGVGAQFIAEKMFQVPYSRFLILLLAPVIFLRTINALFLGFIQGDGNELPTTLCCMLRQLLILGFGLLFGKLLAAHGDKVSKLLGQEAFVAMYGGIGVVFAIVVSEIIILVLLIFFYKASKKNRAENEEDGMRTTDSFLGQIYVLYSNMLFSGLFSFLLILPVILGLIFLQKNATDIYGTADIYGMYICKYLMVCGVVISILAALLLPVAVKTSNMHRRGEHRYAKNILQSGMKAGIIYALFFTVYITVMSEQLTGVISSTGLSELAEMFAAGSAIVLLGALAYYFYVILKQSGRKLIMLGCFGGADAAFAVSLTLLLGQNSVDIMALVYAGLIYTGVLAVSLYVALLIILRFRMDWLRTLAIPVGSVCVTGLICHLLGNALTPHMGNLVTLFVIFVLAWLIYLALVIFFRCFSEQEMNTVPGGRILRAIGQLMGVF